MPIRIMKRETAFKKVIEGTTFELVRITAEEDQRLRSQYTKRGELQATLYGIALCERNVRGWDRIEVEGQPSGYDKSLIQHFPDAVLGELMEAIRDGVDPTSSSSAATLKS